MRPLYRGPLLGEIASGIFEVWWWIRLADTDTEVGRLDPTVYWVPFPCAAYVPFSI